MKKICKGFPHSLKNVIIQTDKQTSQQADDLAPWSCWLRWHCTPFVPCWGEGSSSSSQHASRRVLPLANKLMSRQADEQTSRRDNDSAPRSCQLCWHRTPFVPCWEDGSSSSSQHASRRVLQLAKEDGYIPDWGRKMIVVVVGGGSAGGTECRTQHALQHATIQLALHSALHSMLHNALHSAPQRRTRHSARATRSALLLLVSSGVRAIICRAIAINCRVSCLCFWRLIAWRYKKCIDFYVRKGLSFFIVRRRKMRAVVCSGSQQDFLVLGASLRCTYLVPPCHLPQNISFPLNVIFVV